MAVVVVADVSSSLPHAEAMSISASAVAVTRDRFRLAGEDTEKIYRSAATGREHRPNVTRLGERLLVERGDEIVDRVLVLERVPEVLRHVDAVAVPPADALTGDVSVGFELVDDPLDRARRDADRMSNVTLTQLRIPADRDENMGVIGQKRPTGEFQLGVNERHRSSIRIGASPSE
jgi:hypothetical protein